MTRTLLGLSLVLTLTLAGCGSSSSSATSSGTAGSERTTATEPVSEPAPAIGRVIVGAVRADAPQVSPQEVEAFLASAEATSGIESCVAHFGDMFDSGAGEMEFQVSDEGIPGRLEAPPLASFGGALAGCIFSEVLAPHHFTPWSPPSGVQVHVNVTFERAPH